MIFKFTAKDRKKKEEITSRGDYAPVDVLQPGLKHGPSVGRRLVQLVPMVAYLLGGATLMVTHHIFYSHLNEKRIDVGATELPSFLMSQRNVSFIGTAIAHGARILLAMAISATFIQVFWKTLRSRSHTIEQIDALVNCGQSPFNPSAFRAVSTSLALYAIAIVISATSLVVVFSPGSLTISTNFQRERSCVVPNVPNQVMMSSFTISTDDLDPGEETLARQASAITESMLASNKYLPPFQNDLASVCGDGLPSCSYNISFAGPAFDCVDITDGTNFSSITNPKQPTLLSATPFGGFTGITVLAWDLEKNSLQATNCSSYNATYHVTVNLDGTAEPTVLVRDVNRVALLQKDNSFLYLFAYSVIQQLTGTCNAPSRAFGGMECGQSLGSLVVSTVAGNVTFSDTIPHFFASSVQNASISLLSGNIDYGTNNIGIAQNNLEDVDSTCSSLITVYVYKSTRLLLAYGVTLACSVLVVANGVALILRAGAETNLSISNLIDMALNNDMLHAEKQSGRLTRIQLFNTVYERRKFVPVSKVQSSEGFDLHPLPNLHPTGSKFLTAAHWKMALFIVGTVCAMAFNHAFYQYLDGKAPNSTLRHSSFSQVVLNQTIVSDIGIALAFTGQTFLAVAIAIACHQIFWRAVRNRGYSVSSIDSIIKVQNNPFSFSIFSAVRVSVTVPFLALLATSTPLVSIFAPGSIKVSTDSNKLELCTVLTPQDLSTLAFDPASGADDDNPLETVLVSGSYIPPIDVCGPSLSTSRSRCSYDLQFTGPGFDCGKATTSDSYSSFVSPVFPNNSAMLFQADFVPQTTDDLSLKVFVQTWDVKRSTYQGTNCTGVVRSYSVNVQSSEGNFPVLDVTDSPIVSTIQANASQLNTFTAGILYNYIVLLVNSAVLLLFGVPQYSTILSATTGGVGSILADGNVTWNANLSRALEGLTQNVTLSILSGQILTYNADIPSILKNTTTTCTYTSTSAAYEYTPQRLFLTYGVGIFVTLLCVILGSIAIRRNGVDESMDFSRLLRAILNERMYEARENLNGDTIIKADETPEGALAPVVESSL